MDQRDVGKVVVGPSARRIGRLARVARATIRVETDEGEELWLPQDTVFTIDEDEVTLICEKDSIRHYAVPAPAEEASA